MTMMPSPVNLLLLVAMVALVGPTRAFVVVSPQHHVIRLHSTTTTSATTETSVLSLSLEKPLGMILEEVEENQPQGVYIMELAEEGSAAAAPNSAKLIGSKVAKVMDTDVTSMAFDDVMELLVNAPSPVDLEILVAATETEAAEEVAAQEEEEEEEEESAPSFDVGTPVTVTVMQPDGQTLALDAKVGDNLRKVLIENKVEVYRGLKAKLGNCGGGGQCTFCAVDFVESEGWEERSDYETTRLKNRPNARLSCLNNIQGPVTVQM